MSCGCKSINVQSKAVDMTRCRTNMPALFASPDVQATVATAVSAVVRPAERLVSLVTDEPLGAVSANRLPLLRSSFCTRNNSGDITPLSRLP